MLILRWGEKSEGEVEPRIDTKGITSDFSDNSKSKFRIHDYNPSVFPTGSPDPEGTGRRTIRAVVRCSMCSVKM